MLSPLPRNLALVPIAQAFADAELFNCCAGGVAPDWSQYDALEISGCINLNGPDDEETCIQGGERREDAEFFTVYGHLKWGGVDALTDVDTLERAEAIMACLSARTGFVGKVFC